MSTSARFLPFLFATVSVFSLAAAPRGQVQYTVVDLGFLPGDSGSRPWAINANGDVVGTSSQSLSHQAFVYTDAQGMTALPMPPGRRWAFGCGINDQGQVAVQSSFGACSGIAGNAYRWTPGVGYRDLGALAGGTADPSFINNRGDVVGTGETAPCARAGFLYTDVRGLVTLTAGGATAINDTGQIVGTGVQGAFRMDPAGIVWLGALPNLPRSYGQAIDAQGRVLGTSRTNNGHVTHLFLHTPGQGLTDLGWVGKRTEVRGMSPSGSGVGRWDDDNGSAYGFVWDATNGLIDLNTQLVDPTWRVRDAFAINDRGQIAAFGWQGFGTARAIRLDPLPMASSTPVGTGCGGVSLGAGRPVLGASFAIEVRQAAAGASVLFAIAAGSAVPMPWSPNCNIYVDRQAVLGTAFGVAGSNGLSSWSLMVPSSAGLSGLSLTAQGAALVAPLSLTNGVELVLGR